MLFSRVRRQASQQAIFPPTADGRDEAVIGPPTPSAAAHLEAAHEERGGGGDSKLSWREDEGTGGGSIDGRDSLLLVEVKGRDWRSGC